jgi:hypothetical protein
MKILNVTTLALVAALFATKPVLAAQAIDVSELTCKQLTDYSDEDKGTIMMWFEGYYTEEDEPAVIDFGKMAGHLAEMLIDCDANPDKKVVDAADAAMDE